MLKSTYQFIEHTADMGIEVEAASVESLFQNAGEAFCDIICDRATVKHRIEKKIQLKKETLEELLQAFLNELLFLFEVNKELFSEIKVELHNKYILKAVIKGEKLNTKHEIKAGIKAITYHQLKVWEEKGKWKARVIFDV